MIKAITAGRGEGSFTVRYTRQSRVNKVKMAKNGVRGWRKTKSYEMHFQAGILVKPSFSPTFSTSVSPDAALPPTAQPTNPLRMTKTGLRQLTPTCQSKYFTFSNLGISVGSVVRSFFLFVFLQFHASYLPPSPPSAYVSVRKEWICVS